MKAKVVSFVKIKYQMPILPDPMTVDSMESYYRKLFIFHSLTVIESEMESIVIKKMEAHDVANMLILETKRGNLIKSSEKE